MVICVSATTEVEYIFGKGNSIDYCLVRVKERTSSSMNNFPYDQFLQMKIFGRTGFCSAF